MSGSAPSLTVVDEVVISPSQPQGDVPYSAREGPERARGAKRAKGYPNRESEQIGKFVALFLPLGILSASLYVGLAYMHNRRGVRKLVAETGCDWRQGGRRFLVQHNIESQVYIARAIYVGGTGGVMMGGRAGFVRARGGWCSLGELTADFWGIRLVRACLEDIWASVCSASKQRTLPDKGWPIWQGFRWRSWWRKANSAISWSGIWEPRTQWPAPA
jgi:hypothetical protein